MRTSLLFCGGLVVALAFATAGGARPAVEAGYDPGDPRDARIVGTYRVVYSPLSPEGVVVRRRWVVTPICSSPGPGACPFRVISRPLKKRKPVSRFRYEFDGEMYERVETRRQRADCVYPGGEVSVKGGYVLTFVSRLRVVDTYGGLAVSFRGTFTENYRATDEALAAGCERADSVRLRLTGYLQP